MKKTLAIAAATAMALTGAAVAEDNFNTLDIDLAGWVAEGGYANPGNTSLIVNFSPDTQIIGAEYIDLEFESFGISWNNEFRLSLNDSIDLVDGFWDAGITGTGSNTGPFGPASDTFENSPGEIGSPFTVTTGELYIETYATWTGGVDDFHIVDSGILRITYKSAVPAPGALALLGLAGLVGTRRRR